MTDDKPNWPTEAEVRASFPTPPGFDAYIEVISGLRGEIYTIRAELEEARASEAGAHMIIATERAEVAQLRRRVAELEAQGLPRDRLPWTWRLWVNGSTCATDGRAKTELAAKNALLAAWRDFIARLGLMERIEG